MKRYAIALMLLIVSLCSTAQVTNNAISLERNGRVSLGIIDNGAATTLQLWMNPQHWIPGANIVTWGENLNVLLGKRSGFLYLIFLTDCRSEMTPPFASCVC